MLQFAKVSKSVLMYLIHNLLFVAVPICLATAVAQSVRQVLMYEYKDVNEDDEE